MDSVKFEIEHSETVQHLSLSPPSPTLSASLSLCPTLVITLHSLSLGVWFRNFR